jgi:hypothetical protein
MLKLSVTTSLRYFDPSIVYQYIDKFTDFHP